MPYTPINIAEAIFRGQRAGIDLARSEQERQLNEDQAARQREADAWSRLRRPKIAMGEDLALRGQLLGPVQTGEDYRRVRPIIDAMGLPTQDLPGEVKSNAWMTFRASSPKSAPISVLPAWIPDKFRQFTAPAIDQSLYQPDLAPQDLNLPDRIMESPEDIAAIQSAATRGIPLVQQHRISAEESGQNLRGQELASRAEKYRTQLQYADRAAGLRESEAARKADLDARKMGLEERKLSHEIDISSGRTPAVQSAISEIPNLYDDAKQAETGISTIKQMQGLLQRGGVGGRPGVIKTFLSRFGVTTDATSDAEIYQLLSETMRGPLRREIVGPGTMTDSEQKLLAGLTGGGATSAAAARQLLSLYEAMNRRRIETYNDRLRRVSKYDPSMLDLYGEIQIGIPGSGANPPARIERPPSLPTAAEFDIAFKKASPGQPVLGPDGNYYSK